jgi:deazaflavin-dependent oxidoreductase (nitroreductase family)
MSQESRNFEHRTTKMERLPRAAWRLFHFLPPRIAYFLGLGSLAGRTVLLLKTIGRKSGEPRVTPLLFDQFNGTIYVASARGGKADWYRNLVENPKVEITVGSRQFKGCAEPITDQDAITEFVSQRLERHPLISRMAMRLEGLDSSPSRDQLEEYARGRKLVAIHPIEE